MDGDFLLANTIMDKPFKVVMFDVNIGKRRE